ncbi:MAG: hypothetical protein JWO88_3580 [Frankiales bacterium]|nr:hypothetical protein [Frankiales bacterium]
MTRRGGGLLLGGCALMVSGWALAWPELTILGAAGLVPVLVAALVTMGGAAVDVVSDVGDLNVVRGEPASLRVELTPTRGRMGMLRLVDGPSDAPRRSFSVRRLAASGTSIAVPVDTSRRGLHPVGPFTAVRGDPWSVVRREVGTSTTGSVLVRPRSYPVRQGFATVHRQGDSEAMTRRSGDDHFFALRDYVLGDEPRSVHWRSSARSGRLVVKQKVAAAVDGTLLVLDLDGTAYPSVEAFGAAHLEERFEEAIEVIASLCRARAVEGHRVRLATTSRVQPQVSVDPSISSVMDALAVVAPVQPLDCDPAGLPALARKTHCSRLVLVTGAPSVDLIAAVRRCGSLSPVVVRVGGVPTGSIPGITVIDVPGAKALA